MLKSVQELVFRALSAELQIYYADFSVLSLYFAERGSKWGNQIVHTIQKVGLGFANFKNQVNGNLKKSHI